MWSKTTIEFQVVVPLLDFIEQFTIQQFQIVPNCSSTYQRKVFGSWVDVRQKLVKTHVPQPRCYFRLFSRLTCFSLFTFSTLVYLWGPTAG